MSVRGIKRSPAKMEKNVLRNDSFGCISSLFVKGEKEEENPRREKEFRMKLCNQNGKRREDVDCGTSKRRNKVYSLVSPSLHLQVFVVLTSISGVASAPPGLIREVFVLAAPPTSISPPPLESNLEKRDS